MLLAHRIRLDPTCSQRDYFTRAAGTARRVWNWALAEWLRQRAAGGKPNAMALKKQFNAIKYSHSDWLNEEGNPWLRTMHRDSHAQPFAHLARAWARYFDQIKSGVQAHAPRFKKKGCCPDSFYVANDKFRFEAGCIVLPKLGRVKLRETLRFDGKIMGATVQREAAQWYVSVQVDVVEAQAYRPGRSRRHCAACASALAAPAASSIPLASKQVLRLPFQREPGCRYRTTAERINNDWAACTRALQRCAPTLPTN